MPINNQKTDPFDAIAGYFKTSESRNIARYPPPLIEMNSLMNENEYSNFKLIAKDFLSKNKPVFVNLFIELVQIQISDSEYYLFKAKKINSAYLCLRMESFSL